MTKMLIYFSIGYNDPKNNWSAFLGYRTLYILVANLHLHL